MSKYYIDNSPVEATSFEDAFQKVFGNQVHKEVSDPQSNFYDVEIEHEGEKKFYWVRSG